MEKWNSENIRQFKLFQDIKRRGYYCNGERLTNLYNEIFEANLKPTNCSSCLNIRYNELEESYNRFAKELQQEEEENKQEEENKPIRRGRKKKEE